MAKKKRYSITNIDQMYVVIDNQNGIGIAEVDSYKDASYITKALNKLTDEGEERLSAEAWDILQESIQSEAQKNDMCDQDAYVAWKMGLEAFKVTRALGGKFIYDSK